MSSSINIYNYHDIYNYIQIKIWVFLFPKKNMGILKLWIRFRANQYVPSLTIPDLSGRYRQLRTIPDEMELSAISTGILQKKK